MQQYCIHTANIDATIAARLGHLDAGNSISMLAYHCVADKDSSDVHNKSIRIRKILFKHNIELLKKILGENTLSAIIGTIKLLDTRQIDVEYVLRRIIKQRASSALNVRSLSHAILCI